MFTQINGLSGGIDSRKSPFPCGQVDSSINTTVTKRLLNVAEIQGEVSDALLCDKLLLLTKGRYGE